MFRLMYNGEEVDANRDRGELLLDWLGDALSVPEGYLVEEYHLDIDAETREPQDPAPPIDRESRAEGEQCEGEDAEAAAKGKP